MRMTMHRGDVEQRTGDESGEGGGRIDERPRVSELCGSGRPEMASRMMT